MALATALIEEALLVAVIVEKENVNEFIFYYSYCTLKMY